MSVSEREERLAQAREVGKIYEIDGKCFLRDTVCLMRIERHDRIYSFESEPHTLYRRELATHTEVMLWNHCLSLLERLEQTEGIVRELANRKPEDAVEFYGRDDDRRCFFCGEDLPGNDIFKANELPHKSDCLYKRSQQYLRGEAMSFDLLTIPSSQDLDEINVYWHNYEPRKGMVTVVCYGSAWTAYFGAMPEATIQEFFATADTGYLVNRLRDLQWQKQTKAHERYLGKIVSVVQRIIRPEVVR